MIPAAAAPAGLSIEEGKARLLYGILENTTWPDENQIERFVIGLYGRDRALLRVLERETPDLKVRGKPVVVTQYSSLAQAKAAQVLVLSRTLNSRLEEVEHALHLSHTLVVTDGSDDQRHIMINFTHPTDSLLSFEVNRSNIVYAGLELSKDILLFGGTELDAAIIYKETEAELVRAMALATQQRQQLEEQQKLLAQQKATIEQQRAQVEANKAELAKLEQSRGEIQATLAESEIRLKKNESALVEKERILAEKEAYIASYSERIQRNQGRLEDQQRDIEEQERQIAGQQSVLENQLNTIKNQRFILTAAAAVLLLVLFLVGIIFRSYRSKHRINLKLEGKTRELEVANEQLVQMTEAKSQFLSTMSHEIRTPMNGVIGMAELLERTDLTAQQREYVSLILRSADTLLGLINDILDFSKIEAGRLELEATAFNLRDVLGDTLQALGLRAAEKGLELTCHIPPELPDRLVGDPLRLRQILVNLVGNAIKFTEEGEVEVDLRLESVTDNAVRIVFEVRDTGVGISEQQQRKIFEAFGQADSSTTRQFGGTGLGLSIASQLAEMMGGQMAVTSRPGDGSTFSFGADFALADEPGKAAVHPDSLRGRRALVVDDNSTNRRILDELLTSWGMAVDIVDGGRNALNTLDRAIEEGHDVALALLDVMMPHMDGFELAAKIRERPELAATRIVMLTSAGRLDQERLCRTLDISRTLLKPVKQSDLLETITEVLGDRMVQRGETGLNMHPAAIPSRRVLLVEDNPVNQKVAEDLLARRGHRVTLAQNGAEAVEFASREAFDAVLMDVHMPVMDGLTATRRIRENESDEGGHVPIVAMTAGATTEDQERCFAAGMDAIVTKPFRAAELYRAVEGVAPLSKAGDTEPVQSTADDAVTCLDWEEALDHLEGDENLLIELVGIYSEQCPKLIAEIEEAIAGGEAAELRRAAHTLKGSANIVGGRAMSAAALKLEHIGRDGKFDTADSALKALKEKIAELDRALQARMQHRAAEAGGDRGPAATVTDSGRSAVN